MRASKTQATLKKVKTITRRMLECDTEGKRQNEYTGEERQDTGETNQVRAGNLMGGEHKGRK